MPKVISQKCGICLNFYGAFRNHCSYCGSYKIISSDKSRKYYQWKGNAWVEIVRGVPLPLHGIIDRVIARTKELPERPELLVENKYGARKDLKRVERIKNVSSKPNEVFLK